MFASRGTNRRSRRARPALFALVFALLAVSYQNCTGNNVGFQSKTIAQASGNGEPYGGKPGPGYYYRRVPGFQCGGQPRIYQTLIVESERAELRSISTANCSEVSLALNTDQLIARQFNPDIIGYKDGAFEKYDSAPPADPTSGRVLENWCRTSDLGASTMDIVIHEDASLGSLSSKIYTLDSISQETGLSKTLSANQVTYQSAKMNLVVDLSARTGRLSFPGAGGTVTASVVCSPAAWFDPATLDKPVLAFNFSSPALPPALVFSRSSIASYVDIDGGLKWSSADQPRFEYNSDGTVKGLLIEPTATNMLLSTNEIEDTSRFFHYSVTVLANQALAPDGSMTGDALIEDAAANIAPLIGQMATANNDASHTCSIFAKAKGRNHTIVKLQGTQPTAFCESHVNLSTGRLEFVARGNSGAGTNCEGFIQPAGNGWWRVAVSGIPEPGAGMSNMSCIAFSAGMDVNGEAFPFHDGDGVSGLYVWGIQLETGSVPTSYIASGTSPGVRSADSARVTVGGFMNPASGSIHAIGNKLYAKNFGATVVEKIFSLVGANGSEYSAALNRTDGAYQALMQPPSGAGAQWNSSISPASNGIRKFMLSYGSSTNPAFFVNGVLTASPIGGMTPYTADTLYIGGAPGQSWNGHVKALDIWPARLPNVLAVDLTK